MEKKIREKHAIVERDRREARPNIESVEQNINDSMATLESMKHFLNKVKQRFETKNHEFEKIMGKVMDLNNSVQQMENKLNKREVRDEMLGIEYQGNTTSSLTLDTKVKETNIDEKSLKNKQNINLSKIIPKTPESKKSKHLSASTTSTYLKNASGISSKLYAHSRTNISNSISKERVGGYGSISRTNRRKTYFNTSSIRK